MLSPDRKTNMTAQAESARAQRLTRGVYFLINEFAFTSGRAIMKINSVIFSSDKLIPSITFPHFLSVNLRMCQSGFRIPRRLARKIRVSDFRRLTSSPGSEPAAPISKRLTFCRIIPLQSKHTSCLRLNQFTRQDLEGQSI